MEKAKKYMPVKEYAAKKDVSIQAIYQGLKAGIYKGKKIGSYQLVLID